MGRRIAVASKSAVSVVFMVFSLFKLESCGVAKIHIDVAAAAVVAVVGDGEGVVET